MESTRTSNRLRAKRFKTGTATAEDKAYIEKKYHGECDMNGYVSPFPPGEDPFVKEWTYTPLPSKYVEKKSDPTSIYATKYYANEIAKAFVGEKKAQKKPKRTLSDDSILLRAALISARAAKKQKKDNEVVEEGWRARSETLMKEGLIKEALNKPILIIEEDEEEKETFTQNDAIYLNSLIRDRTNKMRNLLKLDEEIDKLEQKRRAAANNVAEKCSEMTTEKFRNALFELGYINKR